MCQRCAKGHADGQRPPFRRFRAVKRRRPPFALRNNTLIPLHEDVCIIRIKEYRQYNFYSYTPKAKVTRSNRVGCANRSPRKNKAFVPWRERPTSSSAAADPKSAPAVRISDARRPQAERQRARAGPQDRASVARSKPAWRDGPDSGGEGDPRPRRVWAPPGAKRCIPKVKVVHTGRLWIRVHRRAAEGQPVGSAFGLLEVRHGIRWQPLTAASGDCAAEADSTRAAVTRVWRRLHG